MMILDGAPLTLNCKIIDDQLKIQTMAKINDDLHEIGDILSHAIHAYTQQSTQIPIKFLTAQKKHRYPQPLSTEYKYTQSDKKTQLFFWMFQ